MEGSSLITLTTRRFRTGFDSWQRMVTGVERVCSLPNASVNACFLQSSFLISKFHLAEWRLTDASDLDTLGKEITVSR